MKVAERPRKYPLPKFLLKVVDQQTYDRWLARKASAHVKRDRKRDNTTAKRESYKVAIHKAVRLSCGIDAYTGEKLRWKLIGKFRGDLAKKGRRRFRRKFALLPTVDHVGDGLGTANFKICGWRTNDAKSDLNIREFVKLCRRVVDYHEKTKS